MNIGFNALIELWVNLKLIENVSKSCFSLLLFMFCLPTKGVNRPNEKNSVEYSEYFSNIIKRSFNLPICSISILLIQLLSNEIFIENHRCNPTSLLFILILDNLATHSLSPRAPTRPTNI